MNLQNARKLIYQALCYVALKIKPTYSNEENDEKEEGE